MEDKNKTIEEKKEVEENNIDNEFKKIEENRATVENKDELKDKIDVLKRSNKIIKAFLVALIVSMVVGVCIGFGFFFTR